MNFRNLIQLFFGILTYIPGIYYLRTKKIGSGGSYSSRYCYSIWMRHIVMLKNNNFNCFNQIIGEIGPGDSLGVGLMGLLLGSDKYYAYDTVEFANIERNIKIFDELLFLLKNKSNIPEENEFPRIQPKLDSYNFPKNIYNDEYLQKSLSEDRIKKIRYSILNQNKNDSMIKYFTSNNKFNASLDNKVNFLFSQATLEHVDDLKLMYENFKNWISPKGIMSHSIDFKSHGYAISWDGHWSISNLRWKLLRGKRPYLINREPLSTHLAFHHQYNFKIINSKLIKKVPTLKHSNYISDYKNFSKIDKETSGVFIQSTSE